MPFTADATARTRRENDHQPHIAWDLVRIVNVAKRASKRLADIEPTDVSEITASVAKTLELNTTGAAPKVSLRELVVAELCALVETLAKRTSRSRRSGTARVEARELVAEIHSGSFAQTLHDSWDRTKMPSDLDAVLGKSNKDGVAAEQLCWALIGYEAQHHIGLIWHEAHKLCKRLPDCSPEDLFGWGWLGMRVAMRNFDPSRGFRFATYACQRVSGAMRDGVRSEHPLPKRLTTLQRKLSRAEDELAAELGRTPTLAEVADRIGERLEVLEIAPRLQTAASIEELQSATERNGEGWWLAGDSDVADEALQTLKREAVEAAIEELGAEEAEAVRLLYWEGLSVPEAREVTGATARQLRARALRGREALAEILADWR
jgi:RNA polymerase sigma factor for flagellar operon FliA